MLVKKWNFPFGNACLKRMVYQTMLYAFFLIILFRLEVIKFLSNLVALDSRFDCGLVSLVSWVVQTYLTCVGLDRNKAYIAIVFGLEFDYETSTVGLRLNLLLLINRTLHCKHM